MKRCVLWTRWETNEMMYDGVYLRIIMKQYILTLRYYLTKRIYSGFLLGEFRLFSILMFTKYNSNRNYLILLFSILFFSCNLGKKVIILNGAKYTPYSLPEKDRIRIFEKIKKPDTSFMKSPIHNIYFSKETPIEKIEKVENFFTKFLNSIQKRDIDAFLKLVETGNPNRLIPLYFPIHGIVWFTVKEKEFLKDFRRFKLMSEGELLRQPDDKYYRVTKDWHYSKNPMVVLFLRIFSEKLPTDRYPELSTNRKSFYGRLKRNKMKNIWYNHLHKRDFTEYGSTDEVDTLSIDFENGTRFTIYFDMNTNKFLTLTLYEDWFKFDMPEEFPDLLVYEKIGKNSIPMIPEDTLISRDNISHLYKFTNFPNDVKKLESWFVWNRLSFSDNKPESRDLESYSILFFWKDFSLKELHDLRKNGFEKSYWIRNRPTVEKGITSKKEESFLIREFHYSAGGKLRNIECSLAVFKEGETISNQCGNEIRLNESGDVVEVIQHKLKCSTGCGEFTVFREPGKYLIKSNQVRLREDSSQESKVIKLLNKDEIVEVIGDSPKMEYIFPNVAPWVKVRLIDGTSGFVFGAFLRKEEEPDIELINEKAKKWLILNKD